MKRVEILIIGAGVAGLAAAQRLLEAGHDLLVLEACDRIGGRIDTRHEPGWQAPLELGAEFVHGVSPVLHDALRKAGARAVEIKGAHFCSEHGKLRPCGEGMDQISTILSSLSSSRNSVPGTNSMPGTNARNSYEENDEPLVTRLRRLKDERAASPRMVRFVQRFVEGFYAAPIDQVGAAAVAEMERAQNEIEGDRIFRVPQGYDRIFLSESHDGRPYVRPYSPLNAQPYASRICFGVVVRQLGWSSRGVQAHVETATGIKLPLIEARRAVVTVPIGVLLARLLRIQPWPRDRMNALRRLGMSRIIKVFFRFRTAFWPANTSIIHGQQESLAFPTWWPVSPGTVMVGWSASRSTDRLPINDAAALLHAALSSLSRIMGIKRRDLEGELEGWRAIDWGADPFSRGGYAWFAPGGLKAQRVLSTALERTVFFAGEALNTEGHAGTVHGALESGLRAAQEILAGNLGAGHG